jgi:hypothetical protein
MEEGDWVCRGGIMKRRLIIDFASENLKYL